MLLRLFISPSRKRRRPDDDAFETILAQGGSTTLWSFVREARTPTAPHRPLLSSNASDVSSRATVAHSSPDGSDPIFMTARHAALVCAGRRPLDRRSDCGRFPGQRPVALRNEALRVTPHRRASVPGSRTVSSTDKAAPPTRTERRVRRSSSSRTISAPPPVRGRTISPQGDSTHRQSKTSARAVRTLPCSDFLREGRFTQLRWR